MIAPELSRVEEIEAAVQRTDPSVRIFWNNRIGRYVLAQDARIAQERPYAGKREKTWRPLQREHLLIGVKEIDDAGGYTPYRWIGTFEWGDRPDEVVIPAGVDQVFACLWNKGPQGDRLSKVIDASVEKVARSKASEDDSMNHDFKLDMEPALTGRQYSVGGMDARPSS